MRDDYWLDEEGSDECRHIARSTGSLFRTRTLWRRQPPHGPAGWQQPIVRPTAGGGGNQTGLLEAAEVIEQARKQRRPFAGRVTWGAKDYALYNQLAGSGGNAHGRAMVWGAARFDQVDEHGQPAARGIEGQLLRPHEHITRFVPRRIADPPSDGAVASL